MQQFPADFGDRLPRALDAGLARVEAARTFAGIVAATCPALDAITTADAHGFSAHRGYPLLGQLL